MFFRLPITSECDGTADRLLAPSSYAASTTYILYGYIPDMADAGNPLLEPGASVVLIYVNIEIAKVYVREYDWSHIHYCWPGGSEGV